MLFLSKLSPDLLDFLQHAAAKNFAAVFLAVLQKISVSDSLHRSYIIQERRRHGKSIQMAALPTRNNPFNRSVVFAIFAQL